MKKLLLSFLFLSTVLACSAAQMEEEQMYTVCIEGQKPFEITAKKSVMHQLSMIKASSELFEDDAESNSIYLQKRHTEDSFKHLVEYLKCDSSLLPIGRSLCDKIKFLAECHTEEIVETNINEIDEYIIINQIDELMYGLNALGYDQQEFLRIIKDVFGDLRFYNFAFDALVHNGFFQHNAVFVSAVLKEMQLAAITEAYADSRDLAHPMHLGERRVELLKANGLWNFDFTIKDILSDESTRYRAFPQMIGGKVMLNLAHHHLTSLEGLELVQDIDKVTHLRLENNQIAALEPDTFTRYLQLVSIDCGHNKITVIKAGTFAAMPNIERIHLHGNQIAEIEPGGIHNLPVLKTLNCAVNRLSEASLFVFKNFPCLEKLFLNQNQIAAIPSASFSGLPKLQELSLYNNEITEIRSGSFACLPELKIMCLNNNHIESLAATSFMTATQLVHYVRKQELSFKLKKDTLVSFPLLETLWMNTNQIASIDPALFGILPQLTGLDVRGHAIDAEQRALLVHHKPEACTIQWN